MEFKDVVINIAIGLISGIISGAAVSEYYRSIDRQKTLRTGLYEMHMYLSIVRYALEDAIKGDYSTITNVLRNEPYPLLDKFSEEEKKNIGESTLNGIYKANTVISDLIIIFLRDERTTFNKKELIKLKTKALQSSLDLLTARQILLKKGE
ncbi:hypothetical protein [Guptibacillus algicola]|uniref:hypothetical protein n=1 Tax=Guptibacillus algicola TaxID=225844 RepID=UPI001CD2CD01|nr:hypothetical protein [Alkalihalobacillus algicola]MCA0986567.1 hypothetical protein [Alkalihalobacillus algicola]